MGSAFLYMAAAVNLVVGLALIVTALHRWRQKLTHAAYLASGFVSLTCPVLVCVALFAAWLWQETVMLVTMFVVAVLPIAAAVGGIVMLVIAWCRRHNGKLYTPVLIAGIALLLYPLALPFATVVGEIIF